MVSEILSLVYDILPGVYKTLLCSITLYLTLVMSRFWLGASALALARPFGVAACYTWLGVSIFTFGGWRSVETSIGPCVHRARKC